MHRLKVFAYSAGSEWIRFDAVVDGEATTIVEVCVVSSKTQANIVLSVAQRHIGIFGR